MSAIRYSGTLVIRVTYIESKGETFADGTPRHPNGSYRVHVSRRNPNVHNETGGPVSTVYVGAPAFLSHAVDAPEAFDDAARAGLAFAVDEGESWISDAANYSESGYAIARSHAKRWTTGSEAKAE